MKPAGAAYAPRSRASRRGLLLKFAGGGGMVGIVQAVRPD